MEKSKLYELIRLGKEEEAIRLIKTGKINIHKKSKNGINYVNATVYHKCHDVLKKLVARNVDINCQNERGFTPLMVAIFDHGIYFVSLLLENGANLELRDRLNRTAIIIAIERNKIDDVEYLIKKGANLNVEDKKGRTPLSISTMSYNTNLMTYLLDHGAEINYNFKKGSSALHTAINNYGNIANITKLIDRGANVFIRNPDLLRRYVDRGDTQMAIKLIERGLDVNTSNHKGKSLIVAVIKNNMIELFNILEQYPRVVPLTIMCIRIVNENDMDRQFLPDRLFEPEEKWYMNDK